MATYRVTPGDGIHEAPAQLYIEGQGGKVIPEGVRIDMHAETLVVTDTRTGELIWYPWHRVAELRAKRAPQVNRPVLRVDGVAPAVEREAQRAFYEAVAA